jgi:biotin carboxyl carrier protein
MAAELFLIVARAMDGTIGDKGTMPWHLPSDLKRFKALTMGKPMIMGRKTFESFPSPLPGRRHIVLTRDAAWRRDGAEVATSVDAALALAGEGDVAVIGGAEIFAARAAAAEPPGCRPVLFSHEPTSRNAGAVDAAARVVALVAAYFDADATLRPADVAVVMAKVNNSAVMGQGVLVVESSRRDVAHLEGGIVRQIHVRDGAEVKEGDLLLSLDPVRATAALQQTHRNDVLREPGRAPERGKGTGEPVPSTELLVSSRRNVALISNAAQSWCC